jgi:4-hydroxy-3-polyprenylbenzoate decarboxylase
MGLDATTKIGSETSREWGTKIKMSDDIVDLVTKKWPKLGLPGNGTPIWKKD